MHGMHVVSCPEVKMVQHVYGIFVNQIVFMLFHLALQVKTNIVEKI